MQGELPTWVIPCGEGQLKSIHFDILSISEKKFSLPKFAYRFLGYLFTTDNMYHVIPFVVSICRLQATSHTHSDIFSQPIFLYGCHALGWVPNRSWYENLGIAGERFNTDKTSILTYSVEKPKTGRIKSVFNSNTKCIVK